MKRTIYYLFLLMLALGVAVQGCSDDDSDALKEPEIPEEPDVPGDTTVIPPAPVFDTVALFSNLSYQDWATGYKMDFCWADKTTYDTVMGKIEVFAFGTSQFTYSTVTVEWGDKQVIMRYDEQDVEGKACVATYTLNDDGLLAKVTHATPEGSKEYRTEYTDNSFALYEGAATTPLYKALVAAGGTYGNWTSLEVDGITVHVEYPAVGIRNRTGLDLLLFSSMNMIHMPKCVQFAYMAGILPASTLLYSKLTLDYTIDGIQKTGLLAFPMDPANISSDVTLKFASKPEDYGVEADADGVWVSSPSVYAGYRLKVYERKPQE